MKKFLAIYIGPASDSAMKNWKSMEENERKAKEQAGIAAWHHWVDGNKKSIVDGGSPIGKTKRVDADGISDTKNLITGFTLVEAESHEEAAKLFQKHPHFSIFPGECIEIMECLPIPK